MRRVAQPTLFLFYQEGCPACAEVKPIVRKFRDANPDVKVIALDINTTEWKARNWEPQVTPTLVALTPDGRWAKLEESFDEAEFYGWVGAHLK